MSGSGPIQPATRAGGLSPLDAIAAVSRNHPQRRLIDRALVSLLDICRQEQEPEAWRIVEGTLADISEALAVFRPRRDVRKVSVFGSARTELDDPSYQLAEQLAEAAVASGFEVITGAGSGIMEAANRGAGCERSIGLNVDLPFEQHPNPIVSSCDGRLLHFRYFFTRKLFFLRESDALVVLPGGFGTLDELFESLTLIQTGRTPPIPLVLLAAPDDPFWLSWQEHSLNAMQERGLISPEDTSLLFLTDSAEAAMAQIERFYRRFHAATLERDRVELLLNASLTAEQLRQLNLSYDDLVDQGSIQAAESIDQRGFLRPCLRFHFDRRRMGRLYQLIDSLNAMDVPSDLPVELPSQEPA
ncbi:LOG family protein [Cyanobium sp. LEGE 06113]|uniref:LOG family protein n=1 Tax=Cyanobium sp. LEGE 06113 TaxID=1297573 RepID=UPI0018825937|nr:LOG family protein [Cyanobium sp. LEGE 06113]MBE9152754.1 LOG family protein [Cyanobium sp. LEGE 06113]MBE9153041.1 LOG family protein [Cyanobium sp. LEGE 06113]